MLSYFIIFIFGLLVGSFLNSVIYRLENKKGFILGRSICPQCKHKLAWYDLIPVFTFIFLKGRCRYCQKKISWQYPLVELATGLLFLQIFNFQFSLRLGASGPGAIFNEFSIIQFSNLIFLFYVFSSLLVIFVYDLKHFIIPDKIIYPAIGITFVYRLFEALEFRIWDLFRILAPYPTESWYSGSDFKFQIFDNLTFNWLLAGLGCSLFFLAIYLLSKGRWLGFGDVKLALLLGLFLGWPQILVALFLSFVIGAIIGIGLIVFKNKSLKSQVPFAPFLIIGAFIAFFWGEQILDWYLSLFF